MCLLRTPEAVKRARKNDVEGETSEKVAGRLIYSRQVTPGRLEVEARRLWKLLWSQT